jgi:hypothetical protein
MNMTADYIPPEELIERYKSPIPPPPPDEWLERMEREQKEHEEFIGREFFSGDTRRRRG